MTSDGGCGPGHAGHAATGDVDLARLDLGTELGRGSQGTVHAVGNGPGLGFDTDVVYKAFTGAEPAAGAAVRLLAQFRSTRSATSRQALDDVTTWPLAAVVDGPRVAGYLMRRIPDSFRQPVTTSRGTELVLREAQHLFVADHLARRTYGSVPSLADRVAVARELALALTILHRHRFVYGDLSYTNVVYRLRPRPAVLLLDCDSARRVGERGALSQLNSPGWQPPEGQPQTLETDRYKLALFVLRAVTPEENAQHRRPEAATVLGRRGVGLLIQALQGTPGERPTAGEWYQFLDRYHQGQQTPSRGSSRQQRLFDRPERGRTTEDGPPDVDVDGRMVGFSIVRCTACDRRNRVPVGAARTNCGGCGAPLTGGAGGATTRSPRPVPAAASAAAPAPAPAPAPTRPKKPARPPTKPTRAPRWPKRATIPTIGPPQRPSLPTFLVTRITTWECPQCRTTMPMDEPVCIVCARNAGG